MLSRISLCAVLALGLLGFAGSATASDLADSLIGRWAGDADKTAELLKEQGLSDDEIESVVEEIGGVELELKEGGDFVVKIENAGMELEGTWEVASEDEEKKEVKLTMTIKFGDQEQPMDFTFTIKDMDYVHVQPEDEEMAVFKRVSD